MTLWHRCLGMLLLGMVTASCGTRVEHTDEANAPPQALEEPSTSPVEASSPETVASTDTTPSARPTTPGEATPTTLSRVSGQATLPKAQETSATDMPTAKPTETAPAVQPASSPDQPTAAPSDVPNPGEPKSTIVIASAGTFTGPIGSILLPGTQAVQVWVNYTNDRGGINGHPVRVIVYDDGGDPARHRAQVQDAIERQKVVAFVHNAAPFLTKSTQDYVESKRVPVIGTETGTELVYQSPMYFPQATSGFANIRTALLTAARQVLPAGKKKLATLTCVEAQQCDDADRLWADMASGLGFELVNRGRASLTQPDYLAECLSARNAGAEVMIVAMEATATARLAQSCARQGYHPVFGTLASIAADRQKNDPNLKGMMTSSNVFPYFASGTPAIDEFHLAMKRYGSKVVPGIGAAIGWVAAKLFERAASGIGEPPTSADLLRGLWSLNDDTLGSLTSPLTFRPDQLPPVVTCWYDMAIKDREWTIVGDGDLNCQ